MENNTIEGRIKGNCTCHSIRENSRGDSYSLYMLGVSCGYCEAVLAEYQYQDWYQSLTDAQRVSHDIANRWAAATRRIQYIRRPGTGWGVEPPF